ncbi:hypothetical protein R3W88_001238 [Solanum pinnatisectum]|uniref:Small ribosomal subunit protein bS18c n=1 Tax=Solanum pinnatisectum TaxID=50273 RepID=A0AAV9MHY3_9SOLN|nr:hypothetical protein R3W88_001238 [Solanum pinnatisectum]
MSISCFYPHDNGLNFPCHYTAPDDKQSTNSFESTEDFERLLFGDSMGNWPRSNSFFRKLDRVEKAYDTSGLGSTFSSGKDIEARYFEIDPDEVEKDDYAYRADMTFWPGNTCKIKNVRFLAIFIMEAGILIKRSKTGISAKAHRKIAMGIKTARAFGLMPFTTMGTKHFVFGRTMEDLDADYVYEMYDPNYVNCEPLKA